MAGDVFAISDCLVVIVCVSSGFVSVPMLIDTLFLLSEALCVLPSLPIMCPMYFLWISIVAGLLFVVGASVGRLYSRVSCLGWVYFVVLVVGWYVRLLVWYALFVGEYVRLVGEYDRDLGEYVRLVGEYDRDLGEYGRLVGECDRLVGEYGRLVGAYCRCVGEYVRLVGEYDRLVGECVLFVAVCVPLGVLESCVGFVGGCILFVFDVYLMCSAICSLIMVAPSCETWNPSGLVVICLGMFSNTTWVSMISILSDFISGSVAVYCTLVYCMIVTSHTYIYIQHRPLCNFNITTRACK